MELCLWNQVSDDKKTYTQVKTQFPVSTLIVVTEWKAEDSVAGQFARGDPAQQVSGWGKVHEDPMVEEGPDGKKPVFTGAVGVVQVKKCTPSSFKGKGMPMIIAQGLRRVVS